MIMKTAVTQATMLKRTVLVCSPIKSLRLTSKQNEDDDDREPDAVADLRENENFPERHIGDKHDTGTDNDQDGVEPVERGRFTEFVVDASLKAEAFADHVSGGERKDGGGEERSVEQAESESVGQRTSRPAVQGPSRLRRRR